MPCYVFYCGMLWVSRDRIFFLFFSESLILTLSNEV